MGRNAVDFDTIGPSLLSSYESATWKRQAPRLWLSKMLNHRYSPDCVSLRSPEPIWRGFRVDWVFLLRRQLDHLRLHWVWRSAGVEHIACCWWRIKTTPPSWMLLGDDRFLHYEFATAITWSVPARPARWLNPSLHLTYTLGNYINSLLRIYWMVKKRIKKAAVLI